MNIKYKYTDEQLIDAISKSGSIQQVLRLLNIRLGGGNHTNIKNRIKKLNIDVSHFYGQGNNRGEHHVGGPDKLHWTKILSYDRLNGRKEYSIRLRRALLESGMRYLCSECGLNNIWNKKEIILEIDHIDGNILNNYKENLRFLCPNCHSQTITSTSYIEKI